MYVLIFLQTNLKILKIVTNINAINLKLQKISILKKNN